MMSKAVLFCLLLATAWSFPQESDYDDYEYEEEVVEYGDIPEFVNSGQTLVAKEGETINIPCQLTADSPFVLMVKKAATDSAKEKLIFVGDVKVPPERKYKLVEQQLEISNLRPVDSGVYVCRMEAQPPVEVHHTLEVQFAPRVSAVSDADQRVQKGTSVKLECTARGNPTPTITWSRQEGHMSSGAQSEQGDSIVLADVDRHVEGTYQCTADNGVGEPSTASMAVTVEYEPEIITEKAIIRSGEGDTVELVCIVHARPAAEVTWTKEGQPITTDDHLQELTSGHRHSISISQVTEADFGDYDCFAENIHGSANNIIHMTGLPNPPHFTSDPNGGEETSYTLAWDTESYYPIEAFRLKYRKTKANDSTDEPGDWTEVTLDAKDVVTEGLMHSMKHSLEELEPATDYEAEVQIKNQFMWGENQMFAFSTRKVPPTTTPTNSITTPSTTTSPTTTNTFVEDTVGPSSGSMQEVAGQQSTMLNASPAAGINVFLMIVSVMLLRT